MNPTDLTIEILKSIRDEVRTMNERIDSSDVRMDAGFAAVTDRLDRLERRQTETEVRLATELVGVASAVREVRDLLREDRVLRTRVDDHERRIVAIEKQAG
jgi:hypothetical protein